METTTIQGALILQDEWLKLETAVELIGQMIAYHMGLIHQERMRDEPNQEAIASWKAKVIELGQEQNDCYGTPRKQQIIEKAYQQYAPFLKTHAF